MYIAIILIILTFCLALGQAALWQSRKIKYNDTVFVQNIIIDTSANWLNMSYYPLKRNGTVLLYGYGRHVLDHSRIYEKILDLKGNIVQYPNEYSVPEEVKDEIVGEVKSFILNNEFHITTHFFGTRDTLTIFPLDVTPKARSLYFQSKYKNYLWNVAKNKVVPIHYDELPSNFLTQKNFLFFEHSHMKQKSHLVITSVSPHNICLLDVHSGYIQPYCSTVNNLETYFSADYDGVFLSGGPIRLDDHSFLVAGHIAKGGWGGRRMTFFYTFRSAYPFDILALTPVINFGHDNYLEYCNQIYEIDGYVHVSLGVGDVASVLITIETLEIISLLVPVGSIFPR